jgi:predicted Zn-dependent peptidase
MNARYPSRVAGPTFHVGTWLCGMALVTAGCWWGGIATETPRPVDSRPEPVPDEPRTVGEPGAEPGESTSDAVPVDAAEAARVADPEARLREPSFARLPGGLRAAAASWPTVPGNAAWLSLSLHEVAPRRGQRGLAELGAFVLTELPDGAAGRPALRAAIERLGGRLGSRVDATTTSLDLGVSAAHWRDALALVAEAMTRAPNARARITDAQRELARRLTQEAGRDPVAAIHAALLDQQPEGPAAWITQVVDATPTQLARHLERIRTPRRATLAIVVPGMDADALLQEAARILQPWTTHADPNDGPVELAPIAPPSGMAWQPGPGRSRIALSFPVAGPDDPLAPAESILLECLTLDGVGGRLERAIKARLGYDAGLVDLERIESRQRVRELHTSADASQALALRDAWQAALASLAADPPSQAEVRTAVRRVRLRLLRDHTDPRRWTHAVALALAARIPTRSITEADVAPDEAPAPYGPSTTLQAIRDPARLDLAAAAKRLAERAPRVLVIGGEPPVDTAEPIAVLRMAMPREREPERDREPDAPIDDEATAILQVALRAVGGAALVGAVDGCHAASETRSGRGPNVHDRLWFARDTGLRRLRSVLATTIETCVDAHGGSETVGSERVTIAEEEARELLDAEERHPLFLLNRIARGEARYRLVATRTVADRSIAVLERVDPGPERLRLFIDRDSGLIRAVESQERRAIGTVHLREQYAEYSTRNGLRVPFLRTTWIDGTNQGLVTRWTAFVPRRPTAAELAPGGPAK